MLRVRHFLIVFGLIGLMAVPGLVRAVSIGEICVTQWAEHTERSCGFVSGEQVSVWATSIEGGSGTVRAIETVDGVEHVVAWCSFGTEGSTVRTPEIVPSPISIHSVTEVSPAPTQPPVVDVTVTPPPVASRTLSTVMPGGCTARMSYTPGRQLACRMNGTGKGVGIFGCSGITLPSMG